jgi:biotin operon repressor
LRTVTVLDCWENQLMLSTSARLLRLLSLLQTRRDWPGQDLAVRLEVDVRTVRRDIDRLRTLGYPVHSVSGTAGGYRVGPGADVPPLLLDDEEAVATRTQPNRTRNVRFALYSRSMPNGDPPLGTPSPATRPSTYSVHSIAVVR